MMAAEPDFPFAAHQHGSLPFLVGEREIKRGFEILLGTVLMRDEKLHRFNQGLVRAGGAQLQRFDHPKQGFAVAAIKFLDKRLIAISMMSTDLLTLLQELYSASFSI